MADETNNHQDFDVWPVPDVRSPGAGASTPVGAAESALPPLLGLPSQRPVFRQRQPSVEWSVIWPDGGITQVECEAAARLLAAGHSACWTACRLVGAWGPP